MKLAIMTLRIQIDKYKELANQLHDTETLANVEQKIEELERAILWLHAGDKALLVNVTEE